MSGDENPRLFGLQRRERLMDELRQHGSITVSDLAEKFGVSELTIRRDVNTLARQGLVTRVHGGATLRSPLDTSHGSAGIASYTIGMVVPSLDYYWPQVATGARAQAAVAKARLHLRGSTYDVVDNRKQIQALARTPGMHGLIVAPTLGSQDGAETLRWLSSLPLPVVLAERMTSPDSSLRTLDAVGSDHPLGAELAVRHLHSAGHDRIGLLAEPESPTTAPVRRGWRRTLKSLGLADDVVNMDAASFESPGREALMDEILDECHRTETTALLILADPQAVAFVQHCTDRGVKVPEDLAIVAYDDEVAGFGSPAITAVRPPKQFVGRTAVDLLLARLENPHRPPHRITLGPELVVRESSIVRNLSS